MKLAKTSVGHQISTSESVLQQLVDIHPLPRLILEYRQVSYLCTVDRYTSSTQMYTGVQTSQLTVQWTGIHPLPRLILENRQVSYLCTVDRYTSSTQTYTGVQTGQLPVYNGQVYTLYLDLYWSIDSLVTCVQWTGIHPLPRLILEYRQVSHLL